MWAQSSVLLPVLSMAMTVIASSEELSPTSYTNEELSPTFCTNELGLNRDSPIVSSISREIPINKSSNTVPIAALSNALHASIAVNWQDFQPIFDTNEFDLDRDSPFASSNAFPISTQFMIAPLQSRHDDCDAGSIPLSMWIDTAFDLEQPPRTFEMNSFGSQSGEDGIAFSCTVLGANDCVFAVKSPALPSQTIIEPYRCTDDAICGLTCGVESHYELDEARSTIGVVVSEKLDDFAPVISIPRLEQPSFAFDADSFGLITRGISSSPKRTSIPFADITPQSALLSMSLFALIHIMTLLSSTSTHSTIHTRCVDKILFFGILLSLLIPINTAMGKIEYGDATSYGTSSGGTSGGGGSSNGDDGTTSLPINRQPH
eukprot:622679_1